MKPKVAIVTGGSRGLGRSISLKMAEAGYQVAVLARSIEAATATADLIRTAGGEATPIHCDLRDGESIENAVEATIASYGRIDALINNAGTTQDAGVHRMTDENWDAVIETTLTGGFKISRAAQRHMVSQGDGGRIVFIGSIASEGSRGQSNYAAAKAGIIGLAKTMALELGRYDITVNVISPGHIETEMTHGLAHQLGVDYEEIRQARISTNAVNRVGTPDDIAAATQFLTSPAAGYITGSVLVVAGKPA